MNESGDPNARRIDQLVASLDDVKERLNRIELRLGLAPQHVSAPVAAPPTPPAPPLGVNLGAGQGSPLPLWERSVSSGEPGEGFPVRLS
jgi:hypothetical protein